MTPLGALEDLRNCLQAYYTMENVPSIDNNLNIIETALKRLEELEIMYSNLSVDVAKKFKAFDSLSKDYEKVMKELSKEIEKNRALAIIKKKRVDVLLFSVSQDVSAYNDMRQAQDHLTKEEFDLLKEVLL